MRPDPKFIAELDDKRKALMVEAALVGQTIQSLQQLCDHEWGPEFDYDPRDSRSSHKCVHCLKEVRS